MSNKDSWNSAHLVNAYAEASALQKPEETLLALLEGDLKNWRMLDIGIGLGRTTRFFAPLAKEYVGMDYSAGMIETYRKMHPEHRPNIRIQLGDACHMPEFASGYFDFILFSFNGIDYLTHEGRLQAFQEIKRVGKRGGLFAFSSHNLHYIHQLYRVQLDKGLRYSVYQCYRYVRLLLENGLPARYRRADFAILNDGAHHFKLRTYYITPSAQVKQLERLGFRNIRLFSLKTGAPVDLSGTDELGKDSWFYYLCEI